MTNRLYKVPTAALIAVGLLLNAPASLAGGAMTIVPAPESDVPHGNQIPARRIQAIERQISEFNAAAGEPGDGAQQPVAPRDEASTSH